MPSKRKLRTRSRRAEVSELARLVMTDSDLPTSLSDADKWELYHLKKDRTETSDLAQKHPQKVAALSKDRKPLTLTIQKIP